MPSKEYRKAMSAKPVRRANTRPAAAAGTKQAKPAK